MKKPKSLGIFGKVFLYTTLILVIVIGVAALFFTQQITDALAVSQQEQLSNVFTPLVAALDGKTGNDAVKAAEAFHERNSSFEFALRTPDGQILYTTPGYVPDDFSALQGPSIAQSPMGQQSGITSTHALGGFRPNPGFQMIMTTTTGIGVFINTASTGITAYNAVMQKMALALVILLLVGAVCAFLFARSIAKPVARLASDTAKMASLEPVEAPALRGDEIGRMAGDVYSLYERLKETIGDLEGEIKKQREMEESQRYFFAAASHELKTPVAATSALIEGMLEDVVEPKDRTETLRTCLRLAKEQAALISEILELVKLSDEKHPLTMRPVDVGEAVTAVLAPYLTLAEAHAQTLDVQVPSDTTATLDATLFKRALSNVVANALQNTPDGGKVQVTCKQHGESAVRLSVLNEGTGIPDEVLEKLFEPFYRTDAARSLNHERSGLGLTLVEKALSLMGVAFALENTEQGTLFWMDLPQ